MKKGKNNLTILIYILILILLIGLFYYFTDKDGSNITKNDNFLEKVGIEFSSLPQDDE